MTEWWIDQSEGADFHVAMGATGVRLISGVGSLNAHVGRWLQERQAEVPRRLRRTDDFHVSEVTGDSFCPRLAAYRRALPLHSDREYASTTMLLFELGSAIHERWQNDLFGKMRILRGTWRCSRCAHTVFGLMPRDPCSECRWPFDEQKNCRIALAGSASALPTCQASCIWPGGWTAPNRDCIHCERGGSWRYCETEVHLPELGLRGSVDGVLRLDGLDHVLELKSRRSDLWEMDEYPESSHVRQCQGYMWGLRIPRGVVVYVNKNTGAMREWRFEQDERTQELIRQRIADVTTALKERRLPVGTCSDAESRAAHECGYAAICFEGLTTAPGSGSLRE